MEFSRRDVMKWEWTPDGLLLHVPDYRPSDDAIVSRLT